MAILKFVAMNLYYIFSNCRWGAKKYVLGVYNGNIETYTRYSKVADEKRS